jgi:hypothetical protein
MELIIIIGFCLVLIYLLATRSDDPETQGPNKGPDEIDVLTPTQLETYFKMVEDARRDVEKQSNTNVESDNKIDKTIDKARNLIEKGVNEIKTSHYVNASVASAKQGAKKGVALIILLAGFIVLMTILYLIGHALTN